MEIKVLRIYTLSVDGGSYSAFPDDDSQIEIIDYSYVAQRMGSAVVNCTVKSAVCLDDLWTGREFVVLGDGAVMGQEKYFLTHIPGSSKSNVDARYIHSCVFHSERDVVLSSVYFCDAVGSGASSGDKRVSNGYEVKFFGTLSEFVGRYNDVLEYMGLDDRFGVEIDEGVGDTDVKELSFSDRTLFEALQSAYEVWNVPFYFVGGEIHFGEGSVAAPSVRFEYGHDNELLSISKNNTDAYVVTRCTGRGSSDNIPYYYPNPSPKGTLGVGGTMTGVTIANQSRFGERMDLGETLTYVGKSATSKAMILKFRGHTADGRGTAAPESVHIDDLTIASGTGSGLDYTASQVFSLNGGYRGRVTTYLTFQAGSLDEADYLYLKAANLSVAPKLSPAFVAAYCWDIRVTQVEVRISKAGGGFVTMSVPFTCLYREEPDVPVAVRPYAPERRLYGVSVDLEQVIDTLFAGSGADLTDGSVNVSIKGYVTTNNEWWHVVENAGTQNPSTGAVLPGSTDLTPALFLCQLDASGVWTPGGWKFSDRDSFENIEDLSTIGLSVSGTPSVGKTITQTVAKYVTPSGTLMPSVYRSSDGAERFYDALNNTYPKPGGGYYTFSHEYDPNAPKEHIEDFKDIKPSIENLVDSQGHSLNVLEDVFFESGYNPVETLADGTTLKYSCFFVKLKPLTFNLFDCASESGEMTVNMLDGPCAGCKFKIRVDSLGHNTVQVDEDGDLVVADGRVVFGEPQDGQNDTSDNAVWLALYLDSETYGGTEVENGVMPTYVESTGRGQKPEEGDRFNLTNINLPQAFITAAEEALTQAIIKFMAENNDEKYSFAIKFSRIYLAQNPTVKNALNEHCSLNLSYNDHDLAAPLHVSQYTYKAVAGEALPEISVELGDIIEMRSSGLDKKIAAKVNDVVNVVEGTGGVSRKEADARYLRKDEDDTMRGRLLLGKGFETEGYRAGMGGQGAALGLNGAGDAVIDVDFLNVRKKATFSQVEIDKLRQVGGRVLISLASIVCSTVEAISGGYKCYFGVRTAEGEKLTNDFVVGDLAVCQSFGVDEARYYWRKVIEVGDDYIVLSTADGEYDSESTDVPMAGDNIVQLGNVSDQSRQAAQILSCYGDDSPSIVAYVGINTFSLANKDIYGIRYSQVSPGVYQPFFFNYGSMLLGDRSKTDDYVEFDRTTGQMAIKANVVFKAGQSLLGIDEFDELVDGVLDLEEAVGGLVTSIEGWPTVKEALNGATAIAGGLVLTNMIQLGQKTGDVFNVKAGISGIYDATKTGGGLAGWYGGNRWDLEHLGAGETAAGAAKSAIRFDGTGYLAKGNITWDANGYGQVGGSGSNYAVKWDANGVRLGNGVYIGSDSDKTLGSILELLNKFDSWFGYDEGSNSVYIKSGDDEDNPRNFFAYGEVTAGGVGSGGSGGGGLASLWALTGDSDVRLYDTETMVAKFGIKVNGNFITPSNGIFNISTSEGTVTQVKVGTTPYNPVSGVVSLPAYPTTLPASDVYAWAKAATKPSYSYSEISETPDLSDMATKTWVGGNYLAATLKGASNGLAELGSDGKVPSSQLPSYVDDVLEFPSKSAFPATGESGKIYVALDTNLTYRWSGTAYVEISPSLALGETSSTAYRGDRGKIAYDHSQQSGNPHNTTLAQIVGNADLAAKIIAMTSWFGKNENGVYVEKENGQAVNFFSYGEVTAGGVGSGGGGGGGLVALYARITGGTKRLDDTDTKQAYLGLKVNGSLVTPDNDGVFSINTSAGSVRSIATGTGLTGGPITDTGTISIDQTYQTYISHGETAYGYFSNGKLPASSVSGLATVATSGAYDDLSGKPTAHSLSAIPFTSLVSLGNNIDTVYDGYLITSDSAPSTQGTFPTSYHYGVIVNLPYRKLTGNSTTDYVHQIYFTDTNDPYPCEIFVRGSSSTEWRDWHMLYHTGNLTKSTLGLGNVENKSSATIRGELSASNVTTALGNTAVAKATDADTLDGQHASYFATASSLGNYLPLSGGTMSGLISWGGNNVSINWRTGHESYNSKVEYMTSGNEALVFANQNAVTSFMFFTGLNIGNDSVWYDKGNPALQIKQNCVYINSLIGNNVNPSYNLYVNGSFNATSGYINGNTIYHSGNCNNTSTPWSCSNLTASGYVSDAALRYYSNRIQGVGWHTVAHLSNWNYSADVYISNSFNYHSPQGLHIRIANGVIEVLSSGITTITKVRYVDGDIDIYYSVANYDNFYWRIIGNGCADMDGSISTKTGGTECEVNVGVSVNFNIVATGEVTAGASSDRRFKDNQQKLRDVKWVLENLYPVEFDWNDLYHSVGGRNEGHDVGFIAQDVQPLIPSAIGKVYGEYLRLDYNKVTPYLVAGWQSHETRIERLERENRELKMEIQRLRS